MRGLDVRPKTSSQRAVKLEQQMIDAHADEDRKVEELMAQMERDRLAKLAERELEKKAILKKIDEASNADEKREYIDQFEKLQKA